jgi:microcystin-dependent protein
MDPFIGEIKMLSFGFAPRGWAFCNGQLLPINQNQALYSLLGVQYGGNGQTTFALPNLQASIPLNNGTQYQMGQKGGEISHTLTASELPVHTHGARVGRPATSTSPAGAYWASSGKLSFAAPGPAAVMNPATVGSTGNSQPHNNLPPFLVLTFVIALQGIFPSRN